ncbi:MAG: YgiQ family radical SAM protein, partial [Eubacteriales bacterium]
MAEFLPISKADMKARGWEQCDFVYLTGDAYVDHPSFGGAIISRVLESHGYKVGIIAQPNWKNPQSVTALGRPRLGFLVSGGNMDSMVNHYSVSKKHRKTDAYSPGGEMDKRPDYAATVYCNLIRQTYKDVPILLGGIEASLRRLGHYDYWGDKMKRAIVLDSQADLVMYGMGERSVVEIADALQSGLDVKDITFVHGTVYKTRELSDVLDYEMLPKHETMVKDRKNYAKSFQVQYKHTDHFTAKTLVEPYDDGWFVVQNIPQAPMSQGEMDRVYSLDYARTYHPVYEPFGGIPAIEEVKFSLISNRGCFGACNFCALTFHQGRIIQTRSHESLVQEAEAMVWEPDFKGYIHDVGGPTANFRHPSCEKQLEKGVCKDRQCLFPTPCKNMDGDHSDYLALLRKLRAIPKVKKVFIRSGIRFDYLLADKKGEFFKELVQHHVSGQLKVAPEHVSNNVLELMGKPRHEVYEKFRDKYIKTNEKQGKKQFVVPYLMSSHPGCTMGDAVILAEYLRDIGYHPEQVQDFYPTPSTVSTVMYATGLDPRTMKPVYVPTNPHEKAMQRALIQYRNPKNYA